MLQASVAAAMLFAATAQAAVLDFDATSVGALPNTHLLGDLGFADIYYGGSYMESGFVLSSSFGSASVIGLLVPDSDNTLFVHAASSYAMGSVANTRTTLTAANHSAFNITSIDLAKQLLRGGSITFHGVKADGSHDVVQTFNFNDNWKTKTFNSSFTNLSSVYWTQNGLFEGKVQWDNINVTAVPEPETYAMLLAGLGLVGWARRRQQA